MVDNYTIEGNTADGIDHGKYRLEDCFEAVIERYQDGHILCPILWSGGSCKDCMNAFEHREERYE